jgi:hypothetical protein
VPSARTCGRPLSPSRGARGCSHASALRQESKGVREDLEVAGQAQAIDVDHGLGHSRVCCLDVALNVWLGFAAYERACCLRI